MRITPLDRWTAKRISSGCSATQLSLKDLQSYQLERLKHTISYSSSSSAFYKKAFSCFNIESFNLLRDISRLPFTTSHDLEEHNSQFLCVSQSLVERVFTPLTSTLSSNARRIYFSGNDMERIIDFFHHGMTTFTAANQNVMIMMPGERPDSIGDLLTRSLERIPATGWVYDLVRDPVHAMSEISRNEPDVIVGIPANILSLVRHGVGSGIHSNSVKSVLLTSDYITPTVLTSIERQWECRVFGHYGSTEMGFLGGLECEARSGYHLTESDLYFEIADPATGEILEPGCMGEVVFTTLNREAMPLIRYKTSDLSRIVPGICQCGSELRRLEKIRARVNDIIKLGKNHWLGIYELDDSILGLDEVIDYRAILSNGDNSDQLDFMVELKEGSDKSVLQEVRLRLLDNSSVSNAVVDGVLSLGSVYAGAVDKPVSSAIKRAIQDVRRDSGTSK